MANERLRQDIPAQSVRWRIGHLEIDVDHTILNVRFRSDDDREVFRQLSGAEAVPALQAINTRDNSDKTLQEFLLEQAMNLWPDEFAGGTLEEEEPI